MGRARSSSSVPGVGDWQWDGVRSLAMQDVAVLRLHGRPQERKRVLQSPKRRAKAGAVIVSDNLGFGGDPPTNCLSGHVRRCLVVKGQDHHESRQPRAARIPPPILWQVPAFCMRLRDRRQHRTAGLSEVRQAVDACLSRRQAMQGGMTGQDGPLTDMAWAVASRRRWVAAGGPVLPYARQHSSMTTSPSPIAKTEPSALERVCCDIWAEEAVK